AGPMRRSVPIPLRTRVTSAPTASHSSAIWFMNEMRVASMAFAAYLVTTHYMDEAERCHRLAFIFRGTVLDVGTPGEIVARRNLRVADLEVHDAPRAAEALRRLPEVDEVAHYGHTMRLATLS